MPRVSGGSPPRPPKDRSRSRSGRRPAVAGFTALDLLLSVAVVLLLGLSILPLFQRSRRETAVATLRAEAQTLTAAAEEFRAEAGRLPASIGELEAAGAYVRSDEVEYCFFRRVLSGGGTESLHFILAHPGTRRAVATVHPEWGGRATEHETEEPGCASLGRLGGPGS